MFDFNNVVTYKKIFSGSIFEPMTPCFNLNIINLCNAKCPYCYARKSNNFDNFASLNNIKRYLNDLNKLDFKFNILVIGGEPSLHPHLKQIVEECYKLKNINEVILATNNLKKININFDKGLISFHPHIFRTQSTVDAYKENLLHNKKFIKHIQIDIVLNINDFDMIRNMCKFLKENEIFYFIDMGNRPDHSGPLYKDINKVLEILPDLQTIETPCVEATDINNNKILLKDSELQKYKLKNNKGWLCCNFGFDIDTTKKYEPKFFKHMCWGKEYSYDMLNKFYSNFGLNCELEHCHLQSGGIGYKINTNIKSIGD